MEFRHLLIAIVLPTVGFATEPAEWLDAIDTGDLKRHASFLASDTLEGRQAGSRGSQAAAAYLAAELKRLGLTPAGQGNDFRQPFGNHYTNVVAQRRGADATRCEELVVIGAHYDHVGYGNASNSYGPLGVIHNGADDNASGVAALLEIAQAVQRYNLPLDRTIVFAFWDGEEVALLGSQHWVRNRPNAATMVKLALNLDMIGRLRDDGVHVMGWRSAAGLRTAISAANRSENLPFVFEPVVTSDSDHHSFYAARIPVLHFDTGKHDDYHRPTDDVERLNWTGLRQIARVAAQLVVEAARNHSCPAFRPEALRERQAVAPRATDRTRPPVRFGFTWDPRAAQDGIITVAEVTPESPAATAGLRPGDRLLRFHDWEGTDLASLRRVITAAPAETTVVWQCPGEASQRSAHISLQGEPVRWGATARSDAAVPGCVLVTSVMATSPAEAADVQPGDLVLEIDGEPATEAAWQTLSQSWRAVPLLIERDGCRRPIVTRDR